MVKSRSHTGGSQRVHPLRVFNIKCSYWRSMTEPSFAAVPSVTSSFQQQVLLLKEHDRAHTSDEHFGCSRFNIKCYDWCSMKEPTLGNRDEPLRSWRVKVASVMLIRSHILISYSCYCFNNEKTKSLRAWMYFSLSNCYATNWFDNNHARLLFVFLS